MLLDQRGCGSSTPRGCLINNTTEALVGRLCPKWGVVKWARGSCQATPQQTRWGSTALSLPRTARGRKRPLSSGCRCVGRLRGGGAHPPGHRQAAHAAAPLAPARASARGGLGNNITLIIIDDALMTQVGDLEVVRTHLAIDKWLVLGGSWGVALGLAYASAYPQRCVRA